MKMNCLIVDDEPMARKVLEEYIEDIDFLHLAGKAENPLKASSLLTNNKIDLLFLDINMPQMSGIEFLKTAAALPMTIMTTAYTDYAIEGFELDVIDYLIKPFSYDRFLKACTKAKEYFELKARPSEIISNDPGHNYFFVKCDGKIEKVLYDELVYIEAMLNYIVLHTDNKKMIVYHTIKGITDQLPANLFLKIHKSTVINSSRVKSIEGNTIDLGSVKVLISQNLKDEVVNAILKDRLLKR